MRCKVGFFLVFCLSLFGLEHVYLKTPDLSKENILATNVGIRPCRKNGMRIEAERFQDKLVIHNYGYGGSGLTLCFGGAKEVLTLLEKEKPSSRSVAVLGAGFAGLAAAYDLLEQGYEVHLYSDQWSPHLTSNVAGGIWTPLKLSEDTSREQKELYERILEVSRNRFLASAEKCPEFTGVQFIDYYSFSMPTLEEEAEGRYRGDIVMIHLDNGLERRGRKFRELHIDGKLFMDDLLFKIKTKGGVFIERHFEKAEDLCGLEEPTIINCTSLGSRELFSDQEFIPIRGQLVYFKPQEGFDYLLHQNIPDSPGSWVSINPWKDRIILGGIYEYGEEEAVNTPEVIDAMIENANKCLAGEL